MVVMVIKAYEDGMRTQVSLQAGATLGTLCSSLGNVPNSATFSVNGSRVTDRSQSLGNGDEVVISSNKLEAGC